MRKVLKKKQHNKNDILCRQVCYENDIYMLYLILFSFTALLVFNFMGLEFCMLWQLIIQQNYNR